MDPDDESAQAGGDLSNTALRGRCGDVVDGPTVDRIVYARLATDTPAQSRRASGRCSTLPATQA